MRILAVCQHYKPEPFNVSEMCEGLVGRGHEVTILTALPNYPEGVIPEEYRHGRHRDEVSDGVRVVRVPVAARGRNLKGLNKLRRVANYVSFPLAARMTSAAMDDDYDCVICFQFSPVLMALPALRIAKVKRVPCLIYAFDLWPEDLLTGGMSREGVPFKVMRDVSRRIYSSADLIVVTSPGFETYFADELELPRARIAWLPQFAEDTFAGVPRVEPKTLDEVVFTFAGNIGGNQSVETVVEAAALLKSDSRIRIKIAGSGSRLEDCKALARGLGISNVEFLGRLPLEAMPGLYTESDAMLLTLAPAKNGSLVPKYTIPRKFQSYLAASRPIICAVDGTTAEIVSEYGCGVTCRAGDSQALAEAMSVFASYSWDERQKLSAKAAALYQARFSRERCLKSLEELLNELVKEGSKIDVIHHSI